MSGCLAAGERVLPGRAGGRAGDGRPAKQAAALSHCGRRGYGPSRRTCR